MCIGIEADDWCVYEGFLDVTHLLLKGPGVGFGDGFCRTECVWCMS